MTTSEQGEIERGEFYIINGVDCLGERLQNPAQSLEFLLEIAYMFGMGLKGLDRFVERNARLKGERSQSQQSRSQTYRFRHRKSRLREMWGISIRREGWC